MEAAKSSRNAVGVGSKAGKIPGNISIISSSRVLKSFFTGVYMPSCRHLKLAHMYEGLDLLYEQVEKSVFFKAANLLNLDVDIVFVLL
ncbi:putative transposase [Candidatus Magnetominusculus xianensis]|uniref:Transposase n=1 Tax=Candidatus Magnetominusculus xianensis TaxID=1748249 RepID=A0ABR5SFU3_9BACT|nr:putative transposase [Candidatus Magnetominusculus xianensis]